MKECGWVKREERERMDEINEKNDFVYKWRGT